MSNSSKNSNVPVYEKMFSRDFSLALSQIWYFAEYSDPRQWTSKVQPFGPYTVFVKTPQTVDVYVDRRGVDWVKAEIAEQVRHNPKTVQIIANTYESKIELLQGQLDTLPKLSIPDLRDFIAQVRDAWAWFEAFWWLVELGESQPEVVSNVGYLLEVRKRTEKLAPSADAIIRQSVCVAYPEIAKYSGVVTIQEIFSGKFPPIAELEKRLGHYVYTNETLFEGETVAMIEEKFSIKIGEQKSLEEDSVKGQVAYPGKVRGRVRKVYGVAQLKDFEQGEILIAASTTPDLITALHMASAIVSDEGGIVCHAAIVARELKKPCIVGTRHAMEIFKDGDMVEVDATRGLVTIIK